MECHLNNLCFRVQALVAIRNLLQLRTTEALVLRDLCGLDAALERLRRQLEGLMVEEDRKDYAMEVETIRREVELIFSRRLGQVGS